MKKNANNKAALYATTCFSVISILGATPALAQDAADTEDANTIVVTGSRIARQEVDAPIPVAVVSAEVLR